MAEIQKIADMQNERVQSWTPSREFETRALHADRLETLGDLGRDLSSQLLLLSVSEARSGFASTLESLAIGLSADRVSLLLPGAEEGVFELAQRWERASALERGVGSVLDLASMPGLARTLREGAPHRGGLQAAISGADPKRACASEIGWQSGFSTLYLPICGPEGLLGLVVVEAGLAAAH
ncbi:MAG: hypothetical protein V3T64_13505 [Myxococcota bacterium]